MIFVQFLTQSLDLDDFEIDTEAGVYFYITQFRFVVSKWATPKCGSVPTQCLVLPPSFCHGSILTDDTDATTYAQPLIEYNLRAIAAFTNSNAADGTVTIGHQLEVPIRAAPEVFPPCDTEDFFNDFVIKQIHPLRLSIFSFQKYTMTLTAGEPAPVLIVEGHAFESREIVIRVSVTASISNLDTRAFTILLQRIGFRIIPGLRAKTYYSTQPFPKLPVQALLTVNGPHRLHDQVLKLEEVNRSLTSWRFMETDAVPSIAKGGIHGSTGGNKLYPTRDGQSPPAEWQSKVTFAIKVPNDATPTFCSAIAARQYSVLILLKATGVNVKDFVLEVPIQLVSAPIRTSSAHSSDLRAESSEMSGQELYQRCQNTSELALQDESEPPPKYM